jgi:tryptophanyl-tRNA synthetase
MEKPKNPDTCHVFHIYKLLASKEQITEMRNNYEGGNYGYGHAKQALFELIIDRFKKERENFNFLMAHPDELEKKLQIGEEKARLVANETLKKVRKRLGF